MGIVDQAAIERALADAERTPADYRKKYGIQSIPDPSNNGVTAEQYVRDFLYDPGIRAQLEAAQAAQSAYGAAAASAASAARSRALRELDIQKKRLEFQQATGMRDIEKIRGRSLEDAVRNALRRGIYRSGIRIRNENRINRDQDDATSDLQQKIQFALDSLNLQRESINASGALSGLRDRAVKGALSEADAYATANQVQQDLLEREEFKRNAPDTAGGVIHTPYGGPK